MVSQSLGAPRGGDLGPREPKGTSHLPFQGLRLHVLVDRPHFISDKSESPKTVSGFLELHSPLKSWGLGLAFQYIFLFPSHC